MIFIEVVLVVVGALFVLKRHAPIRKLPIAPCDYFQDMYMEHLTWLSNLRPIHSFDPIAQQRAQFKVAVIVDLEGKV